MIDFLFSGGVSIKLKSLKLDKAAFNVLGIGVAVSDNTSIELFIFFIFSFARTPNLCSSSITSNLKLLNITVSESDGVVTVYSELGAADRNSMLTRVISFEIDLDA